MARKAEPSAEREALFTAAPLPVAPLGDSERLACLRLIRSENVGPVTFRELINHYGGAEAALAVLPELSKRGGRGRPIRICQTARAEAELEAAEKAGSTPLFTIEPGYPALLAHAEAPPPLLYVKGRAALLNQPAFAIVGSRQCSAAGQKLARHFASALGRNGLVIASGLARGIDAAAHEAAIATGTIAVLAGGIDVLYPPEHQALYDAISERGCLVAEMPPGYQPRGQDFPRRNRIISGISHGVLIVEAAKRSGTLVTARYAGEQGREVFAVPGHPLDPRAEGTNQLLKSGATIATEPDDILEALAPLLSLRPQLEEPRGAAPVAPAPPQPPPLPITENDRAAILSAPGPAPTDIDAIARTAGLSTRAAQIAIMELDLAGRIARHGSGLISRSTDTGDD